MVARPCAAGTSELIRGSLNKNYAALDYGVADTKGLLTGSIG